MARSIAHAAPPANRARHYVFELIAQHPTLLVQAAPIVSSTRDPTGTSLGRSRVRSPSASGCRSPRGAVPRGEYHFLAAPSTSAVMAS